MTASASHPRRISRRGVLLGVLAASGTALAVQRFPWEAALRAELDDFLFELLRVVAVPDPVRVGEARLREAPDLAADGQALLDAVFADLPVATAETARELAELLRDAARRQFAAGDIVLAGGWTLARIEADFCTLIALDRRPRTFSDRVPS